MKRSSFIKSLFMLAASPKILAEVEPQTIVARYSGVEQPSGLVSQLSTMSGDFYQKMIDKYGGDNYGLFIEVLKDQCKQQPTR
jgi:hypothetical protein